MDIEACLMTDVGRGGSLFASNVLSSLLQSGVYQLAAFTVSLPLGFWM